MKLQEPALINLFLELDLCKHQQDLLTFYAHLAWITEHSLLFHHTFASNLTSLAHPMMDRCLCQEMLLSSLKSI